MPQKKPLSNQQKIPWEGSQMDFVNMVEIFTAVGGFENKFGKLNADEVGNLFLKIFEVDLSPYPDFASMRVILLDPDAVMNTITALIERGNEQVSLDEALEGTGAVPSENTMLHHISSFLFAEDIIERLSEHVHIPKE